MDKPDKYAVIHEPAGNNLCSNFEMKMEIVLKPYIEAVLTLVLLF